MQITNEDTKKKKGCVETILLEMKKIWKMKRECQDKKRQDKHSVHHWLGGKARCTMLRSKLSQDHLELFFSSVRTQGGFNNNPTAKQFTAADKLLLVKHQVKTGKDNCLLEDDANIFRAAPSPR